jgi:DNA polymerase III sliding clamp (beta) subunit (PCNA family)
MRFTVNRKVMLEHLKTMVSLVPKTNTFPELKGFLIEANEDDGHLYLTANNMEAAIQRKFITGIEEGGFFVIDARTLISILFHLNGDEVVFEKGDRGGVKISTPKCTFTMSVLDGELFPRPNIPFPDSTVKVAGMKKLYNKTSGATSKDTTHILNGIHIEVLPNSITATGCDARCIAAAAHQMDCGGSMDFTLPKASLSYLVSAAGDEELEVGKSGNFIIFMKEGMLFSAKRLAKEYVNTNMILDSLKTVYEAKLEFKDFKEQVQYASDMSAMGVECSYVRLDFEENCISLTTGNDVGSGTYSVDAVKIGGESGRSFYYPSVMLKDLFKTVDGTMILRLDARGYLLVFNRTDKYLITPITSAAVEKQNKKYEEQMKKARGETADKSAKKTRSAKKAA